MIVVTIPIRTVTEGNAKEHWRTKAMRAKGQRRAAWAHVRVFGTKRAMDCVPGVVTMTRIAPRVLDDDNLVGSQKHIRDGIADALGIDDRDPRVKWAYAQERGKPKEYAVRIEIRPREDDDQ